MFDEISLAGGGVIESLREDMVLVGMLLRERFEKDLPWAVPDSGGARADLIAGRIEGCYTVDLEPRADERGYLMELLTTREGLMEPMVHAYQVFAAAGSMRAWTYHAKQTDRLCFADGRFRVFLFDLREESSTYRNRVEIVVGEELPVRLVIPPFVAHGAENVCGRRASFVNLPTAIYDPNDPDKHRLAMDSPLLGVGWSV